MEVIEVKVNVVKESEKKVDDDFWAEYADAYFEYERMEKMERLREYEKAYNEIEDKDSFNAQYIEVIIANLKSEI
jgi:hypothetical protein